MITIKKQTKIEELNLDGYKHIKNNEWDIPENLEKWLKERDFKELGEGSFSKVFSSQTENFVVKMNKGKLDKEYLEFVNYCLSNKSNPHLPKIGKPKMLDGWYIVFIEKLEERNIDTDIGIPEDEFAHITRGLTDLYINNEKNEINNLWNDVLNFNPNANPQILEITKIVADIINSCPDLSLNNFDLHDENIMMRGDTIVIVDPLWQGVNW